MGCGWWGVDKDATVDNGIICKRLVHLGLARTVRIGLNYRALGFLVMPKLFRRLRSNILHLLSYQETIGHRTAVQAQPVDKMHSPHERRLLERD